MSQLHDTTVIYFRAAKNYFWRWAEEGQIIEWTNGGATICFKKELLDDLSRIQHHLPPIGPFLLVIACRKRGFELQSMQQTLLEYVDLYSSSQGDRSLSATQITAYKTIIVSFFALLRSLPGKYWIRPDRDVFLNTLFEPIQTFFHGDTAREMLAIADRGAYDYVIAHDLYKDTLGQLESDIKIMERILNKYPDAAVLENQLNAITNTVVPPAAPIEIPADIPKPAQWNELLQTLAEDHKTALLALLTQRLIAALHLPMHTKGYSETFVGGVSDITNKGDFDRLLLSELAQEEDALMARLANNEALYLRREELPDNEPGQRFILVDKSIKTWGTPHMLEMAAALACAIDNKQQAEIMSFALLGDHYTPMNISSKEEIIAGIQYLSPDLHSAKALAAFTNDHSLHARQEYFLITADELFLMPAFQHSFAVLRKTDGFVITVNRDAQIHLYRYAAGHRKLLSTAKISLEMPLLQPASRIVREVPASWKGLPAFLQTRPFQLYIPQQLSNIGRQHGYFAREEGALVVTKHRQLLFWPEKQRGAIEITTSFPDAHGYFFGTDGTIVYILFQIKGSEQLSLYHFNTKTHELSSVEVKNHESVSSIRRNGIRQAPYKEGVFLICIAWPSTIIAIDARTGIMMPAAGFTNDTLTQMTEAARNDINLYWQSYNTINSIKHLEINNKGGIAINKHEIIFQETIVELLKTDTSPSDRNSIHHTEELIRLPDTQKSISRYKWPDGSEAWFDYSRHMLHLRSSNKLLAEVTIVLVVNHPTTCWASDGTICGASYFWTNKTKVTNPMNFHKKYINPFIQVIQQHGTAAVI